MVKLEKIKRELHQLFIANQRQEFIQSVLFDKLIKFLSKNKFTSAAFTTYPNGSQNQLKLILSKE